MPTNINDFGVTLEGLPQLLTLKEVAAILRVSEAHARRLATLENNPLRVTKVSPRRSFVTRENLIAFLDGAEEHN